MRTHRRPMRIATQFDREAPTSIGRTARSRLSAFCRVRELIYATTERRRRVKRAALATALCAFILTMRGTFNAGCLLRRFDMKMTIVLLVAVTVSVAPHFASADEYLDGAPPRRAPYDYGWREPSMASQIGIGVALGAGVSGFTDSTMRIAADSDVSGTWGARATFGSHIPVGVDVSYTGSSVTLSPIGMTRTGTLVGTNVEGALRWNILPHYVWNPYAFAGVGWQRYDVMNGSFTLADSGIADQDDLVVMPMGGGLAWRDPSGLAVDVRGTFRLAEASNFVIDTSGNRADLHTWEASAGVGYEF
jgi:hypothetical protein